MENLSDRNIQKLSEKVNLIANSDTWIEGKAIQQLQKTAELDGIEKAVGMPDLHPGRGYPIGAAYLAKDKIYPALIGNDIGCGMALWKTNIKINKVNLDKFEKRLSDLDKPLDVDWNEYIKTRSIEKNLENTDHDEALGTIGGGNHFAELQQIDEVSESKIFESLNLDKKSIVILVHSGSRGLGESILRKHVEQFGHKGLNIDTEFFDDYLKQHDQALKFAELNRELIAKRILERLNTSGESIIDVNHNLVSSFKTNNSDDLRNNKYWIHRKGATPSDKGLVMIPGSRGDYSYLIKPITNILALKESLYSLAHGAGRKWMRSDCKDKLSKRYKKSDLERTSFGSRVICKNKDLLFEEAPEAYKSISSVIQVMKDAGLITLIARFKPVLTYKTNGGW